jgi:NAD(P)-dependent dehydrogenase (short-subunit alcohol dehydrogenase family)
MAVGLVTGGSRGLGLALGRALAGRGWALVVDARGQAELDRAAGELVAAGAATVVAVPGDVADPDHRRRVVAAAREIGGLDLLVNNASVLGPSPQPALADYPLDVLERVYAVNVVAPLALVQLALPLLEGAGGPGGGHILNITSDAAVEGYPGWGGYGTTKAALDQLSNVLAAEEPGLAVWSVDPGEMNTRMLREAGEDADSAPSPETVVPALLRLIGERRPSGRYQAKEL